MQLNIERCLYIIVLLVFFFFFKSLSHVQLFVTAWTTVAHQAPLSKEFPRQEYWSGSRSLLQ